MERILTLNIGATRLALAEFEVRPGQSPSLARHLSQDFIFKMLNFGIEFSHNTPI